MPYFITAFFRGIRNIFFRRYRNPQRNADDIFLDTMSDPHIAAFEDRPRNF